MIGWRAAVVVATVATSVVAPPAASLAVKAIPIDGRVATYVTAGQNWTPEVREYLKTGNLLTFSYEIELSRPVFLWPDSVMGRARVDAAAKLDVLTSAYQVTRQRDGNIVKVERRNLENEVREWLTVVDSVTIEPESPLRLNNDYYVSVRLIITPRRSVSIFSLLPGGSEDASGRFNFTYIR